MDCFSEQIVKVRKSPKELMIQIGVVILGLLLFVVLILGSLMLSMATGYGFFGMLAVLLCAGDVYGMYWVASQLNVEYEYIITNGDLDVDKIIAKKARKRIMSIRIRDMIEYGQYDPERFRNRNFDYRIVAATVDETAMYAVFEDNDGTLMLIFSPNEKTLQNLKKYAPRVMQHA